MEATPRLRSISMTGCFVVLGLSFLRTTGFAAAGAQAADPPPEWHFDGPGAAHFKVEWKGSFRTPTGATLDLISDGTPNLTGIALGSIDATLYRGRRIRISAEFRAQGSKTDSAFVVRVDSPSGMPDFFDNGFDAMAHDDRWVGRDISIPVRATAARISIGVYQAGSGSTQVRNIHLQLVDDAEAEPHASALLEQIIRLVHENAYFVTNIDWDRLPEELRHMNRAAKSTPDVYPTASLLLRQLGDRHSLFRTPAQLDRDAKIRRNVPLEVDFDSEGIVRLLVRDFGGTDEQQIQRYVSEGQSAVDLAAPKATCDWIFDPSLRHGR